MPTDQNPSDPYDLVLADLRAKRDEIDHMIAQIEKFRAALHADEVREIMLRYVGEINLLTVRKT